MSESNDNILKCICCKKSFDACKVLFFALDEAKDIYICEHCVKSISSIIDSFNAEKNNTNSNTNTNTNTVSNLPDYHLVNPEIYKKYLDEYIISQDMAKKIFTVAIYNHLKRVTYNLNNSKKPFVLDKSNILMIGPSGVGKTLMIETMCKKLNIPYSITDATTLTEAGYVGADVENVLKKLIQNANGDIKRAEFGVVFIDEIDKLGRKGENPSITRDVGSEGVQQALLKMIDGTEIEVSMNERRRNPLTECVKINTKNILFICSGAFEKIDNIIKKRLYSKSKASILESSKNIKEIVFNDVINEITSEDLIKFGMLPELLGRLSTKCTFEQLGVEDLIKILTEPKNAIIKQYIELFKMENNIEIEFEEDCLIEIANKAIESKTGARSLRSILDSYMYEYMYSVPTHKDKISKIIFTKESFLDKNKKPIFIYRKGVKDELY